MARVNPCGPCFLFLSVIFLFTPTSEGHKGKCTGSHVRIQSASKSGQQSVNIISEKPVFLYSCNRIPFEHLDDTQCRMGVAGFMICQGTFQYTHVKVPVTTGLFVGVEPSVITQIHADNPLHLATASKQKVVRNNPFSVLNTAQESTAEALLIQGTRPDSVPESPRRSWLRLSTGQLQTEVKVKHPAKEDVGERLWISFEDGHNKEKVNTTIKAGSVLLYPDGKADCEATDSNGANPPDQTSGAVEGAYGFLLTGAGTQPVLKPANTKNGDFVHALTHLGVNKSGLPVSQDTGYVAKGAEEFSHYVSTYLWQLLEAVGVFRHTELESKITLSWLTKVSRLQGSVDALGLRFALEIAIGRQLGYFSPDLINRLTFFRKKIESIICQKLILDIDKTSPPSEVPGHHAQDNARSMAEAIEHAMDYWEQLKQSYPAVLSEKSFTDKTVKRLKTISDQLKKNPEKMEKVKDEVFVAFAALEALESDYTYHSSVGVITPDGGLVSLAWVNALTPGLRLERIKHESFSPRLFGAMAMRDPAFGAEGEKIFRYALKTNIPGVLLGFNDEAGRRQAFSFLQRTFSDQIPEPIRLAFATQTFVAGELVKLNHPKVTSFYHISGHGFPLGYSDEKDQLGIVKNIEADRFAEKGDFYNRLSLALNDELGFEQTISVGIHELSHVIDRSSFEYGGDLAIELLPGKRVRWNSGTEERIATGTRFLGDNPFLQKGSVPPFGWITENTYHFLSDSSPVLFYPLSKRAKNPAVATPTLHIPEVGMVEGLDSVTFSRPALYFQNLREVFEFLNELQANCQLVKVLRESRNLRGISPPERQKIMQKLMAVEKKMSSQLERIVEAIVLSRYVEIRDNYFLALKKLKPEEYAFKILGYVQEAAIMFSGQLQLPDHATRIKFGNLVRDQAIKHYTDIAEQVYNVPDARKVLGIQAKRFNDKAGNFVIASLPKIDFFSELSEPYSILDIDSEPGPVYAFREFAKALGVAPEQVNLKLGTEDEYRQVIHAYVTDAKGRHGNQEVITSNIITAADRGVEMLFRFGGDGNALASILVEYLQNATPYEKQQFIHHRGLLVLLSLAEKSDKQDIIIDEQVRQSLEAHFKQSGLAEVQGWRVNSAGNMEYLDSRNRIIRGIPEFDFGQRTQGYGSVVSLSNGDYLYVSLDTGKRPHFIVKAFFVERTQWLLRQASVAASRPLRESWHYLCVVYKNSRGKLSNALLEKFQQILVASMENPLDPEIRNTVATFFDVIRDHQRHLNQQNRAIFNQSLGDTLNDVFTTENLFSSGGVELSEDNIASLMAIMRSSGVEKAIQAAETELVGMEHMKAVSLKELVTLTGEASLEHEKAIDVMGYLHDFDVSALPAGKRALFESLKNIYGAYARYQESVKTLLQNVAVEYANMDRTHALGLDTGTLCNEILQNLQPYYVIERKGKTGIIIQLVQRFSAANEEFSKYVTGESIEVLYRAYGQMNAEDQAEMVNFLQGNRSMERFALRKQMKALYRYLADRTVMDPDVFMGPLDTVVMKQGVDGLASMSVKALQSAIDLHLHAGELSGMREAVAVKSVFESIADLQKISTSFTHKADAEKFLENWGKAILDSEVVNQPDYVKFCIHEDAVLLKDILKAPSSEYQGKLTLFTESVQKATSTTQASGVASAWTVSSDFEQATVQLRQQFSLGDNWVPVLSSVESTTGGGYEIEMMDMGAEKPDESLLKVQTRKTSFIETKNFIDKKAGTLGRSMLAKRLQAAGSSMEEEGDSVSSMNAAFALQTMMSFFQQQKMLSKAKGNMAYVLQAHMYLNLYRIFYGVGLDIYHVARLIRTLAELGEIEEVGSLASVAGQSVIGGMDAVMALASVGFDIYELTKAKTETQKAIIGTQLAFDATSAVMGVATVGLGIAAAAGVSAAATAAALIAGPATIVAGLGVGVTAMAVAYSRIADEADAIGKFFDGMEKTYTDHGFSFDSKHRILSPVGNGIIDTVDFREGNIRFGSHYMYQTHRGGSDHVKDHKRIDWSGDFPKVDTGKPAVSVRQALGYQDKVALDDERQKADIMVLPVVPKTSVINYDWNQVPGSTTHLAKKHKTLIHLQDHASVDAIFYCFPAEYAIDKITETSQKTTINVLLDEQARVLVFPKLPKDYDNSVNHHIHGSGGTYQLSLNDKARLYLYSDATTPDTWMVDNGSVGNEIKITGSKVTFGKSAYIELAHNHDSQGPHPVVLVNTVEGDIYQIDFHKQRKFLISVNGESVSGKDRKAGTASTPRESLQKVLGQFAEKGLLKPVTEIRNYHSPKDPKEALLHEHQHVAGKIVKTAYYVARSQQFLFAPELSDDARLLQVIFPEKPDHIARKPETELCSALFYEPKTRTIHHINSILLTSFEHYPLPELFAPHVLEGARLANDLLLISLRENDETGESGEKRPGRRFLLGWHTDHFVLHQVSGDEKLYNTMQPDSSSLLPVLGLPFKESIRAGNLITATLPEKTPKYLQTPNHQVLTAHLKKEEPSLKLLQNDFTDSGQPVGGREGFLQVQHYLYESHQLENAQTMKKIQDLPALLRASQRVKPRALSLKTLDYKEEVETEAYGDFTEDTYTVYDVTGMVYLPKGVSGFSFAYTGSQAWIQVDDGKLFDCSLHENHKGGILSPFTVEKAGYYRFRLMVMKKGGPAQFSIKNIYTGKELQGEDAFHFKHYRFRYYELENMDTARKIEDLRPLLEKSRHVKPVECDRKELDFDESKVTEPYHFTLNSNSVYHATGFVYLPKGIPHIILNTNAEQTWIRIDHGHMFDHATGQKEQHSNLPAFKVHKAGFYPFEMWLRARGVPAKFTLSVGKNRLGVTNLSSEKTEGVPPLRLFQAKNDAYFYFDPTQKALYVQEGPFNPATPIVLNQSSAVEQAAFTGSGVSAWTDAGTGWMVTGNQQHWLTGVNRHWLSQQKDWVQALKALTAHSKPDKKEDGGSPATFSLMPERNTLIAIQGLQQRFLIGKAYFLKEDPESVEHALSLIAGKKGSDYLIRKVDFSVPGSKSFSQFLGDNAELVSTKDRNRAHKNVVHVMQGKIWLEKGLHTFEMFIAGGIRLRLNDTGIINESNLVHGSRHQHYFEAPYSGSYDFDLLYFSGSQNAQVKLNVDGFPLAQNDYATPVAAWYDPEEDTFIAYPEQYDVAHTSILQRDHKAVWFHDRLTKKLYRQSIVSGQEMSAWFDGYQLTSTGLEKLPVPEDVLAPHRVQSVQNDGNGTVLITDSGLHIRLGENDHTLVLLGAGEEWLTSEFAMKLPEGVKIGEVITLYTRKKMSVKERSELSPESILHTKEVVTGLYLGKQKQRMTVNEVLGDDHNGTVYGFDYIGRQEQDAKKDDELLISARTSEGTELILLSEKNDTSKDKTWVAQRQGLFSQVRRIMDRRGNSTVLLQGVSDSGFPLPILADADTLYVTINEMNDRLRLSTDLLSHYDQLIVADEANNQWLWRENDKQEKQKESLTIELTGQISLVNSQVELKGEDVVVEGGNQKWKLTLANARNTRRTLMITVGDISVNVAEVCKKLSANGGEKRLALQDVLPCKKP